MDYAQFRNSWDEAMRHNGFGKLGTLVNERIGLAAQDRLYQMIIPHQLSGPSPHMFYVTAELFWRWDALLSARFATTEEDLLTEILGRKHPVRTEPHYLRVDIVLHASLPGDRFYPLPGGAAWRDWVAEVASLVAPHFPMVADDTADHPAVISWQEEPEIQVQCGSGGQLYLLGVSLAAAQMIRLPRQWDDPGRRSDPQPDAQLDELFERVNMGMDAWAGALDELVITRRDS